MMATGPSVCWPESCDACEELELFSEFGLSVAACDVVQHAASQARLVIRRLYGDQATAYTCTLPFARGLAGR